MTEPTSGRSRFDNGALKPNSAAEPTPQIAPVTNEPPFRRRRGSCSSFVAQHLVCHTEQDEGSHSSLPSSDGLPYLIYNVGTTIMLSKVEVVNPHRITIAIGV